MSELRAQRSKHHIGRPKAQDILPQNPQRSSGELEQIQQLLTSAKGYHLETLFVLALVTGMRRGELLALKWKDVNFAESTLYVRRAFIEVARKGIIETEAKTAKGRRSIRLPPLAIESLKSHRTKQLEAQLRKARLEAR